MNQHLAPVEPVPFRDPDAMIGALPAGTAATLLSTVGDLALVVDADGVIRDVAISSAEIMPIGIDGWIGRSWADTVAIDSVAKVQEMLADAAAGKPARWRQVNHGNTVEELPIRYLTVALTGGRVAAIGRDVRAMAALQQRLLHAQQSLERDYLKMRQAEARYRLLFDLASEPVLIIDAATRKIREANPAAHRVLGAKAGSLPDQGLASLFAADRRDSVIAFLGAAEAADDIAPITVPLARGGEDVRLSARLFRQARQPMLLIKVGASASTDVRHTHDAALSDVIERMPDAFVLTDDQLTILTANGAFAELIHAPDEARLRGEKLGVWLGRPGIDLDLILGQLRDNGVVRNASTVVRDATGATEEIELSAVTAPAADGERYGFSIRSVGRRLRLVTSGPADVPRSVEQLTELVGRMSMKEIVRESTDLIERLCIEAALNFTSDNKASAAEVLGLSRQSLYSKMHRHGLGNLSDD